MFSIKNESDKFKKWYPPTKYFFHPLYKCIRKNVIQDRRQAVTLVIAISGLLHAIIAPFIIYLLVMAISGFFIAPSFAYSIEYQEFIRAGIYIFVIYCMLTFHRWKHTKPTIGYIAKPWKKNKLLSCIFSSLN